MLQNWNLINYSYQRIFKCTVFIQSHYVSVINWDVVSSFSVFSQFDSISQLEVLLIWINKVYISKKKVTQLGKRRVNPNTSGIRRASSRL